MRTNHKFALQAAFCFALISGTAQGQYGAIAYSESCFGKLYATRSDGAGSIELTAPASAPSGARRGRDVADLSTSGPLTMITADWYVTQINDVGGQLSADAPVLIRPPDYPEGWGALASFSPTGDRLAYFDGIFIIVADVTRDLNGRITGVANRTEVIRYDQIGSPSDSNAAESYTFHGNPDFSPDGTQLAVISYSDLWIIDLLTDGHGFAGKHPLTRTYGVTELSPAFSPDGTRIAYAATTNEYAKFIGGWAMPVGKDQIYTVAVGTGAVVSVLNRKTRGQSTGYGSSPTWSPDSSQIVFAGPGATAGHSTPCRSVINTELFRIAADGVSGAVLFTNTVGTGSEKAPRWGW
jgi:hypothetical protein